MRLRKGQIVSFKEASTETAVAFKGVVEKVNPKVSHIRITEILLTPKLHPNAMVGDLRGVPNSLVVL